MKKSIQTGWASRPGRHTPVNQDHLGWYIPQDPAVWARRGALFIVADGMGSHAAGGAAGQTAVQVVLSHYYADLATDPARCLQAALARADQWLGYWTQVRPDLQGMGTTLSAAAVWNRELVVAHVGDSRVYVVRQGRAWAVTRDHTWVAQALESGDLTSQEVRRHPWRNVNVTRYQSSLWCFVLGDNPNWGYGIPIVCASLGGGREPTAYHTIARLGQKKGLWKNGVRGFGDFFGEYAARMVTLDMVEQDMLRSKHGMPLMSYVYPVYGRENTYRVPNSETPNIYGFNIIRLIPEEGAREISVDFHGFYDPGLHSDWRACIVAVDGEGKARYSPMWNKGKMTFALKPSDRHT